MNVSSDVQESKEMIERIRLAGLPYEPKRGKGTKGFKVANIWIGNEYLEMVRIKKVDGGGWIPKWTEKYLKGHRGLIGFALDVDDIEATYQSLVNSNVKVSKPEPLKFRWFFNLFSKTMPWKNAYLPEFEGVPFQFFLQQLDNEKTKLYMQKYMVPNSIEENIHGIVEVIVYGNMTDNDKSILRALFKDYKEHEGKILITIGNQLITFVESENHYVEVILDCSNELYSSKEVKIENVIIRNS